MEKYTKLFFLNFFLIFLITNHILGNNIKYIDFKGDYFIYGEDQSYIYGGGNIIIKTGKTDFLKGNTLYFDINDFNGILMGSVIVVKGKDIKRFDEIRFSLFPFKYTGINFGEKIVKEPKEDTVPKIRLLSLNKLKQSAVFYELKEFYLYKSKKIIGRYVVPYIMGLPSFPFKRFVVKKTEIYDKTMFFVKNLNYSQTYGLSLISGLVLKGKSIEGNYDFRLFERELFKLSGEKRGINISGESKFKIKGKKIFNISSFLSSDNGTFGFNIYHENKIGDIFYSLNQSISGMKGEKTYTLLSGKIIFNKWRKIIPSFSFRHNYKSSFLYKLSTHINPLKHLNINLSYARRKNGEEFVSDSSKFSSSINFSSSIISLSSNIGLNKDFIRDSLKKDFSLNFKLPDLNFMDNIDFSLSPFYTFSEFPINNEEITKNNFGLNFAILSSGIRFPLGFILRPSFNLYQLWESSKRGKTNFNYMISFEKRYWKFNFGIDYNLSSSYFSDNFWIEGYNLKNMNLKLEFSDYDNYSIVSRFYFNNGYKLENISFNGLIKFPLNIKVSSYAIYNNLNKKIQTFEIFIEKNFRNKFGLQGGYSLLLKRFYIKIIPY